MHLVFNTCTLNNFFDETYVFIVDKHGSSQSQYPTPCTGAQAQAVSDDLIILRNSDHGANIRVSMEYLRSGLGGTNTGNDILASYHFLGFPVITR